LLEFFHDGLIVPRHMSLIAQFELELPNFLTQHLDLPFVQRYGAAT